MKLCLVTSTGAHLYEVYRLKKWWGRYERFWVTFDKEDTRGLLDKERVIFAHFPEHRHLVNFLRNFLLAAKVLWRERPDLIFSTGAGIAPPFFFLGKILGAKLVFMEIFGFVDRPTLSGRLVAPLVDEFLVQHETLKQFYPQAKYWGNVYDFGCCRNR